RLSIAAKHYSRWGRWASDVVGSGRSSRCHASVASRACVGDRKPNAFRRLGSRRFSWLQKGQPIIRSRRREMRTAVGLNSTPPRTYLVVDSRRAFRGFDVPGVESLGGRSSHFICSCWLGLGGCSAESST